jgi:hypothetical protein
MTSGSSGIGDAITDALILGNLNTKRKEELRKAEFLRIGQVKKLKYFLSFSIKNSFKYILKSRP